VTRVYDLQAAVAMEDREEKLDAIYNMIEKDLSLVGKFFALIRYI
jgi:hypothetical protein